MEDTLKQILNKLDTMESSINELKEKIDNLTKKEKDLKYEKVRCGCM